MKNSISRFVPLYLSMSIWISACGSSAENDPDQPAGFRKLDYTQPAQTTQQNTQTSTPPAAPPVQTVPVEPPVPADQRPAVTTPAFTFPNNLNENMEYWSAGKNWNSKNTDIYGTEKALALILDKKVTAKDKNDADVEVTLCSSTAKKPRNYCLEGGVYGNPIFLTPLPEDRMQLATKISFSAKIFQLGKSGTQITRTQVLTTANPKDYLKMYYANDLNEFAFAFVGFRSTYTPPKNSTTKAFNYTSLNSFWEKLPAADAIYEIVFYISLLDAKNKPIAGETSEGSAFASLRIGNLTQAVVTSH